MSKGLLFLIITPTLFFPSNGNNNNTTLFYLNKKKRITLHFSFSIYNYSKEEKRKKKVA